MAFDQERIRQILLDNNKIIDANQTIFRDALKRAETKINANVAHLAELEALQRSLRLANLQIKQELHNMSEVINANLRQLQVNNLNLLLEILSSAKSDVVPSR